MRNKIFSLLLLLLLTGCKTKERIVESVRTDTCYVDRWQRDSIYIERLKHDSVTIREKGDSVIIDRWHTEWRDRWRDRVVHDSVYIAQRDTLHVTDIKEVEQQLTWWQKTRLMLGNIMLGIILGLLFYVLLRHKLP